MRWDAPVLHEKVNDLEGWLWGIGDTYAALPYARAYKEFIEDWVLLVKSLSKIAYQAVPKKGLESQKMRQAVQVGQNAPAGGWAMGSEGTKIEAVPKTGATIDSDSGRPVAALVAAAMGVSVIDLLADPGQAGNRATAVTMDLVKRLEMRGRQELCEQTDRATLDYVIEQAIIAPRGPLKGTVVRDGDRLKAVLAGDDEATLEFVWPKLDEVPLDTIMKAIEIADGTGTVPKVELSPKFTWPLIIGFLVFAAAGALSLVTVEHFGWAGQWAGILHAFVTLTAIAATAYYKMDSLRQNFAEQIRAQQAVQQAKLEQASSASGRQ